MASTAPDERSPFGRPGPLAQVLLFARSTGAGKRLQTIFDDKARAWRRRVRVAAVLGSAIPLVFVAGVCLLLQPRDRSFLWGFGFGASAAMYLGCLELAIPDWIDHWRIGADGERRTARRLRRLQREGWIVHHSVLAERGDRDHIIVGPRGIFLLDTKQRRGRVTVEAGTLVVQHEDSDRPAKPEALAAVSKARARELAVMIAQRTRYRPYVLTAIVVWGDFPQKCVDSDGVTFVHGDCLIEWLENVASACIPDWLEHNVIQAIAEIAQGPRPAPEPGAAYVPFEPVRA